jgi:hypothetical protein
MLFHNCFDCGWKNPDPYLYGSGSGRPKNFRIRNTGRQFLYKENERKWRWKGADTRKKYMLTIS